MFSQAKREINQKLMKLDREMNTYLIAIVKQNLTRQIEFRYFLPFA